MCPIAIGFHAEKLHDDQTWRRVEHAARWMGERGIKATFFVYPFRAQVAGKDITDRVQAVAAFGHEIGQHTHFYAGTKIDKGEKVNDLSEKNIVHCLNRDYATLEQMGYCPRAFTAGAWLVNRTVWDTLVSLRFAYDCSGHYPKPKENLKLVELRSPRFYSNSRGRVLCLPTTCSLGEWFRWGRKVTTEGKLPYQLIYLHDYDLPVFRNRVLFPLFLNICRRKFIQPLATIAQHYQLEEVE